MADRGPTDDERSGWSVEESLREAQTDRTPDHDHGYAWAEAAHARSQHAPAAQANALRGRSLVLMAVRGELAGMPRGITDADLLSAHNLLTQPDVEPREIANVAIASLRVAAIRLRFGADPEAAGVAQARRWFHEADTRLHQIHQASDDREHFDRYLTMLMRHAGTMEALSGDLQLARELAGLAITYAQQASSEGDTAEAHKQFVTVQVAKARQLLTWLRAQPRATTPKGLLLQQQRMDELLGRPNLRDRM